MIRASKFGFFVYVPLADAPTARAKDLKAALTLARSLSRGQGGAEVTIVERRRDLPDVSLLVSCRPYTPEEQAMADLIDVPPSGLYGKAEKRWREDDGPRFAAMALERHILASVVRA